MTVKLKQARKHARDARDFNNIETRAVIKFFFHLKGKAPKEIHAILTETLACFLPGRAKDLSAPLYKYHQYPVNDICSWTDVFKQNTTTTQLIQKAVI